MPVGRYPLSYLTSPQASGTARLYSCESWEGVARGVNASTDGWALVCRLSPGLWIVRNISEYQLGVQLAVTRPNVPARETDPNGVLLPVRVPFVYLSDPLASTVSNDPARQTSIEIDVDHRGADLWAVSVGNEQSWIRYTMIARRASGDFDGDIER